MARHSKVCHMLTCALAALLVCGAPAKAAPMGEAAITAERTSNKSGTLEIGKIDYDIVNTIHTEFPSTDTQPYTSTEAETEAEIATTLLPMTIEEMALAEVALVVAKLATTTTAELEGRDQVKEGYTEQIRRSAKKDRQQVFARELPNVGASVEDVTVEDRGFVAATTFRTSLPHQIDTTTTTTPMSPITSTASSITTESPAILSELVRAAVAANEILAAALNVATMAVPNINITTPTTKVDIANLATITAVANHALVNDSEVLLETTEMNTWQHNNVENIEVTSAIPDYTILPQWKKNEALKNNPDDEAEANEENLPAKELEGIQQHQTTKPVDIQEATTESITISADEETTNLSNMDSVLSPRRNLSDMDHEVSESMIIEKRKEPQQTLALPPPSSDKDFENATPDGKNLVINTTGNIATQTEPDAESTTFVASFTKEKLHESTETEDLKQMKKNESLRESGENTSELAVRTTTTESLETLIAVESEARLPNKVDFPSDKESLETITTTSELTTIEDSSSNKLSIASESIWPTNETTTISTDENLTTESATNQQITYTTIAPKIVITTTGALEEDMITTESPDVKTDMLKMYNIAVSERSKMLTEDIQQTTLSSSPTYTSNSITETSQTEHPELETSTVSAEALFTSFDKEEKTTQNSLETIETTTKFIEEEITRTGIPLEENISTQSEISPTEASTILANFEEFPNAQPTEMSQQTSTEDITILYNNPETTTSTNKVSAKQPSELDDPKRLTSAEIRKTLLATTEKELSTKTTENKLDSEDVAESEASTATTTMAAIEEQPHHTSTAKEQLQQQRVISEGDSATITTNTAATTEESTVENVDVATTTTTADIIPITTSIMPKLDVTTIIISTTPETDVTTTTTTTTTNNNGNEIDTGSAYGNDTPHSPSTLASSTLLDDNNDSGNISDTDTLDSEVTTSSALDIDTSHNASCAVNTKDESHNNSSSFSDSNVALVRVYGNKTDLLIDRKAETRNILLLHTYGFAPTLFATFKNGLVYDFVPGVTLKPTSVLEPKIWRLVATRMAEMHRRVQVEETLAAEVVPMLWHKTQSFFDLVPERFSDPEKHKRVEETFLPIKRLRDEFNALYRRLERLGSPVVFAHNDLLLANIVYLEAEQRVNFIDYEYADYNFLAFDIGNHFCEFAGVDEADFSRYPKRDFQLAWLRVYLQEYLQRTDITDAEVERLYLQVNQFALAAHMLWTVWSLIQGEHSNIDFDYVDYAHIRYAEYKKHKSVLGLEDEAAAEDDVAAAS
uniref:ethanolamine kinase n=1 Tax=Bactrocera dorsalis TaxID=27457 RepID=A0A034V885_BACDO